MPFGLVNSAATFTRMMRKLLRGLNDVDIDDLLVQTPTWEAHIKALKSLLQRLRTANLTAKLKKCLFVHSQLEYVGHEVGGSQIGMSDDNFSKVKQATRPITKRQLRYFLDSLVIIGILSLSSPI